MTMLPFTAISSLKIRLATSFSELRTLLKLRYEVMRTEFPMYVPENLPQLDIDQWDEQSQHLGLWWSYLGRELPIGYMRIIQSTPSPVKEVVGSILRLNPDLQSQCQKTTTSPIKFFDKYQSCSGANMKYHELPSAKIMEGSRLAVKKEYRSMNPGRLLVEASFAMFFNEEHFPHGFMEVRENHLKAYSRFGFRDIASTYVPEDQCSHYLCYAHYSDMPGWLAERIGAMRQEFSCKGEITLKTKV